jgi:hypothetical protein
MGRRIRKSDLRGDLEQMLKHCLELADINGLQMTAIRIATAIDQYDTERLRGRNAVGNVSLDIKAVPLVTDHPVKSPPQN